MKRGIISYDITNTRIRTRLAKLLCGYGRRVQFSVFEFELSDAVYNELFDKLVVIYNSYKKRKNTKDDVNRFSIRLYFICNSCAKKIYFFDDEESLVKEISIF